MPYLFGILVSVSSDKSEEGAWFQLLATGPKGSLEACFTDDLHELKINSLLSSRNILDYYLSLSHPKFVLLFSFTLTVVPLKNAVKHALRLRSSPG